MKQVFAILEILPIPLRRILSFISTFRELSNIAATMYIAQRYKANINVSSSPRGRNQI